MLLRKPGINMCYVFPPRLINVSALPCETENMEIVSLNVNVLWWFENKHTKSYRNFRLITVRLLFIHKMIGCVHQTRLRKGTRHSATCFAHT